MSPETIAMYSSVDTIQRKGSVDFHTHGLTFAGDKSAANRGLDLDSLEYRFSEGCDWFHKSCGDGLFVCDRFSSVGPGLLLGYSHPFERQLQSRSKEMRDIIETNVPLLPEHMLSLLFDLCDTFHSLDRGLNQIAVVAHGDISALFEIDGRVLW
jgi:hypothetical protein